MSSPMASKAYDDIVKTLSDSCEKIAEKSMNEAATEIHDLSKSSNSVIDTSISLDGSWQKKRIFIIKRLCSCIFNRIRKSIR